MSYPRILAIALALIVGSSVAAGVSLTLTRAAQGLCTTLGGKSSPILVHGRGC